MSGRQGRDKNRGDGASSKFYPDIGLCALTKEWKLGPEMERAVFLRGLMRLKAQGMGSSDLSLLLLNIQKLLSVLSDSHSDIAISVLMRNVVNVGNVSS